MPRGTSKGKNKAPTKRKGGVRIPAIPNPPSPSPIPSDEYPEITDSTRVTQPVDTKVHECMTHGWKVNTAHPMCYIFDVVNPTRIFKEGMRYNENEDFPDYEPEPWHDSIGTDCEHPGLMPYMPKQYTCVYCVYICAPILTLAVIAPRRTSHLKCEISIHSFMNWTEGEMRNFELGTSKKRRGRNTRQVTYITEQIRAPYDRILCQLLAEDKHAETHKSHEAVRRQTYAREVLDKFVKEFKAYKGLPASFRSYVLTPILQRQLIGVPDAYFPSVSEAVAGVGQEPTIEQATQFYLGEDPTDSELIPNYRYNMVFIPEVRWHLGIVLGHVKLGDESQYNNFRENQDILMEAIREGSGTDPDGAQSVPAFGAAMVRTIVKERLELFFGTEMGRVVRIQSS
jgi:hypothetical protein